MLPDASPDTQGLHPTPAISTVASALRAVCVHVILVLARTVVAFWRRHPEQPARITPLEIFVIQQQGSM